MLVNFRARSPESIASGLPAISRPLRSSFQDAGARMPPGSLPIRSPASGISLPAKQSATRCCAHRNSLDVWRARHDRALKSRAVIASARPDEIGIHSDPFRLFVHENRQDILHTHIHQNYVGNIPDDRRTQQRFGARIGHPAVIKQVFRQARKCYGPSRNRASKTSSSIKGARGINGGGPASEDTRVK